MITIKNPDQRELFDPWNHISPKRKMLLEESWAGLFKNEILSELPVAELAPYIDAGRLRSVSKLMYGNMVDLTWGRATVTR